jgi:hypothetical protein
VIDDGKTVDGERVCGCCENERISNLTDLKTDGGQFRCNGSVGIGCGRPANADSVVAITWIRQAGIASDNLSMNPTGD